MATKTKPMAPQDHGSQLDNSQSTETELGADSLAVAAQALADATRASVNTLADATQQSVQTLSGAAQALTQATQQLTATVAQLSVLTQTRATETGARDTTAATAVQINVWEDDPFSEASPSPAPTRPQPITVGLPSVASPLLQVAIAGQRPAPSRYSPGTANFRYWTAAEALARGVGFWAARLPVGTRWSTRNAVLQVTLVVPGDWLNATYSRVAGLRFYQANVRNVVIFSGESPDVVLHELGHAVLDAVRPELFHAASIEAAAFHEAFGDMSSILVALQLPTVRQKVLQETNGRLNVSSRLSRVAEQLGWGIRQRAPEAVDADCLRNAANRFFYQPPESLPPRTPAARLSSEAHSFARVFTGAFLDALARMLTTVGAANDANLLTVARDMGQLLVDGVRTARITPAYYSQVAAAMIQADRARNNGRYRMALADAFLRRGILAPAALASLASAPVPRTEAAASVAGAGGMGMVGPFGGAGFGGSGFADEASGADSILAYDDGDDAYQRGFGDTPELPEHEISLEFDMGDRLVVHAAAQPERFAVASASVDVGFAQKPDADHAARSFVEDLLQLGRIDFGRKASVVPELSSPAGEKTHTLEETAEGLVLKRVYFDCCARLHHATETS
ncbi:MAG: hypothetical protein ABR499_10565 [Gemmatimonadaceae bacterium]